MVGRLSTFYGAGLGLVLVCGAGCGPEATSGVPAGTAAAPSATAAVPVVSTVGAAGAPAVTTAAPAPAVPVAPAAVPVAPVATPAAAPVNPAATPVVPGTAPAANPTTAPTGMVMAPMQHTMGECGLKTKYSGDEYCILPPPPDKGFQLHIGPTNYDNPELQYLLQPGAEPTTDFGATSSNTSEQYFYYREYRMRPGAHHNIITSGGAGDSGLGQRIGTVNSLVEDYPKGGIIAPENKGVGIKMQPNTRINVSLHSINTTEKTELREMWVNFWFRPKEEVTEPVNEVFVIAPMGAIAPSQEIVTRGSCSVGGGKGRMLWMYGHRHASTDRFTVWRNRAGKKDLVYQGYSWEEPLVLDYSSTVMNAVPGESPKEGGWSGILDTQPGDSFSWECHVVNKSTGTLVFSNNTYTGEMCILDAEMVGSTCN